jgi:hypothetical protein
MGASCSQAPICGVFDSTRRHRPSRPETLILGANVGFCAFYGAILLGGQSQEKGSSTEADQEPGRPEMFAVPGLGDRPNLGGSLVIFEDFVGYFIQNLQSERLGFDLPSHLKSSRTGGISKRVHYNSCLTFHFAPTGNESRRAPSGSRLLCESDQRPQFILAHIEGHLSHLSYRSRAFFCAAGGFEWFAHCF